MTVEKAKSLGFKVVSDEDIMKFSGSQEYDLFTPSGKVNFTFRPGAANTPAHRRRFDEVMGDKDCTIVFL